MNFVKVVRAVETVLGVTQSDITSPEGILMSLLDDTRNATASLLGGESYGGSVGKALVDAASILAEIVIQNGLTSILFDDLPNREPLVTA